MGGGGIVAVFAVMMDVDSLLCYLDYFIYHSISAKNNRLFNGRKGHDSGCKTDLSGMQSYLYRVYRLTPPTSLCSGNTQNLHRSTVERIPKCQE